MSSRGPQYAQLGSNFVDRDREARKARIDRISTKIHAFFWVLSAVLTFYYMDVWNVMLHDSRVNRYDAPQRAARSDSRDRAQMILWHVILAS